MILWTSTRSVIASPSLEQLADHAVIQLSFLYNMNCAFEEQRWIRMASKFFDQTGKRIEPEWLKDKLKNCM